MEKGHLSLKERMQSLIVSKIPVKLLPPYGQERSNFAQFLHNLPIGGLGFHTTSSAFKDSVQLHGLDPKRGFRKSDNVHYLLLDPQFDDVVTKQFGIAGMIATYYRLKNAIRYTLNYPFGDLSSQSLVVFSHASKLAVWIDSDSWKIQQRNSLKAPFAREYSKPVSEFLRNREFLRTSGALSLVGLPEAKAPRIPSLHIIEIFNLKPPELEKDFISRVLNNLIGRFQY